MHIKNNCFHFCAYFFQNKPLCVRSAKGQCFFIIDLSDYLFGVFCRLKRVVFFLSLASRSLSGSTPYKVYMKNTIISKEKMGFLVRPSGVEPESVASEATVLSIRLRAQINCNKILSLCRPFVKQKPRFVFYLFVKPSIYYII